MKRERKKLIVVKIVTPRIISKKILEKLSFKDIFFVTITPKIKLLNIGSKRGIKDTK